jgi:hypothetical protein
VKLVKQDRPWDAGDGLGRESRGDRLQGALHEVTRGSWGSQLVGTCLWAGCLPWVEQGRFCRGDRRLGILRHRDCHNARGDQARGGTRRRTGEARARQLTK